MLLRHSGSVETHRPPKLLPLLMPLPGKPNNGIQVQMWDEGRWGGGLELNAVDGDDETAKEKITERSGVKKCSS